MKITNKSLISRITQQLQTKKNVPPVMEIIFKVIPDDDNLYYDMPSQQTDNEKEKSALKTLGDDFLRKSVFINDKQIDMLKTWKTWLEKIKDNEALHLSKTDQLARQLILKGKSHLEFASTNLNPQELEVFNLFISREFHFSKERQNIYMRNYIQGLGNICKNFCMPLHIELSTRNITIEPTNNSVRHYLAGNGQLYASGVASKFAICHALKPIEHSKISASGLLELTPQGNKVLELGENLEIIEKIVNNQTIILTDDKDKIISELKTTFDSEQKQLDAEFESIKSTLIETIQNLDLKDEFNKNIHSFIENIDKIKELTDIGLPGFVEDLKKINQLLRSSKDKLKNNFEIQKYLSRYSSLLIINKKTELNQIIMDIINKYDSKDEKPNPMAQKLRTFLFFHLDKLNHPANPINFNCLKFLETLCQELPEVEKNGKLDNKYLQTKTSEFNNLLDPLMQKLKQEITDYREIRKGESKYLNCFGTLFNIGYSKTDKRSAAKKFLNQLNGIHSKENQLSSEDLGALRQGRLGTILAKYENRIPKIKEIEIREAERNRLQLYTLSAGFYPRR